MMCERYVRGTEPKHIQGTFSHLHAVFSADSVFVFIFCSWRIVYEKHSVEFISLHYHTPKQWKNKN